MTTESYIPTDRTMLMHLIAESDPEEVCSMLRLSSRDLMLAFPKKLDAYISKELSGNNDEDNDDEEVYEDDF